MLSDETSIYVDLKYMYNSTKKVRDMWNVFSRWCFLSEQNLGENPSASDLNFPVALDTHTGLVKQSINLNKDRVQFRRAMCSLNQNDRHFFFFGRMQEGRQNNCGNYNLAKP